VPTSISGTTMWWTEQRGSNGQHLEKSLLSSLLDQHLAGGVLRRCSEPCSVPCSHRGIRKSFGQALGA
jgi:hypothetical protein